MSKRRNSIPFVPDGGPPDPITAFARIPSSTYQEIKKLDDQLSPLAPAKSLVDMDIENVMLNPRKMQRREDPPARERPTDGNWPYRSTLSFTRSLMFYGAGAVTVEHVRACRLIEKLRSLRKKYQGGQGVKVLQEDLLQKPLSFRFGPEGIVQLYHESEPEKSVCTVPALEEFHKDYSYLVSSTSEGAMRSFCFQRLQLLSTAYKMHTTMNNQVEMEEQSNLLGTDFYRTMKIDNHIHAAAAPTAKQFVEFLRTKLETEGDTVVLKNGKTLKEIYGDAGLDDDHLTIDAFNVLADYSVYQRFDNFNRKYSPFKMEHMRRIFLKTTNYVEGRYFAHLLKIVLNRLENSKGHNSAAELRLSIYGMERHEWKDLANWMLRDWEIEDFPGPLLSTNNRWIIQIPRLWRVYKKKANSSEASFGDMLVNIFAPLFEATLYPEKHPQVAELLKNIVGIDSVDDEGTAEDVCSCEKPTEWKYATNPSYWWQLYHIWANMEILNQLRNARGLNTLAFRPHAGETGDVMHLGATYLLCQSINHGVNLEMQVSLQYLYYLDQIGLSVSPLSNNFLFRKMKDNPFPKFFRRGLNVTLSTDDPLLFHLSDDALLEEYSVARTCFELSMTDMMELARNSILQSGFEEEFKKKWLGKDYKKGVTFCDENITHVPLIRAKFRAEHLAIEHMLCYLISAGKGDKVLEEMKVQFSAARDAHRNCLFENFDQVPSFPAQNQL